MDHESFRDYGIRVLHRKQASPDTLAMALELYHNPTTSHGFVNNAIMRELLRAADKYTKHTQSQLPPLVQQESFRDYGIQVLQEEVTPEKYAHALELYHNPTTSHGFVNNAVMRELIRAAAKRPCVESLIL